MDSTDLFNIHLENIRDTEKAAKNLFSKASSILVGLNSIVVGLIFKDDIFDILLSIGLDKFMGLFIWPLIGVSCSLYLPFSYQLALQGDRDSVFKKVCLKGEEFSSRLMEMYLYPGRSVIFSVLLILVFMGSVLSPFLFVSRALSLLPR